MFFVSSPPPGGGRFYLGTPSGGRENLTAFHSGKGWGAFFVPGKKNPHRRAAGTF